MSPDVFTIEARETLSERERISKRLFHHTGRRRGSHADCMVAAAAICSSSPASSASSRTASG